MTIGEMVRNAPGSVGEYSRTIVKLYITHVTERIISIEKFVTQYNKVITIRGFVYKSIGAAHRNFLLPASEVGTAFIHTLIDDTTLPPETNRLKLDLATIIFFTIFLESDNKREYFAKAEDDLLQISLLIIHEEVKKMCPFQVNTSEEEFISYGCSIIKNMKDFLLNS